MGKSIEAPVEPRLLVWARESAGLERGDVAKRLGVKESVVAAWEEGDTKPTIAKARAYAKYCKRPLGAFFLPEPPMEPPLPTDFRTLPPGLGEGRARLSRALLLAIRKARRLQELAAELAEDTGLEGLLPVPEVSLAEDPESAAATVRARLGVSIETQRKWIDSTQALVEWRKVIERTGVLVLQMRDVPVDEARAFALPGPKLKAIVLNAKDAINARVFSLFHEYGHVALGDMGICDMYERATVVRQGKRIEVFCNRLSAALLVPASEVKPALARLWEERGSTELDDEAIDRFAGVFHVSYEAAITRLATLGFMPRDECDERLDARRQFWAKQPKTKRKGGPSPALKAVWDNGYLFTSLALKSYNRGAITSSELSDYLGARLKHVDSIEQLLNARLASP